MKETEIKKKVREGYARIATKKTSCYAPTSSCCGGSLPETISKSIGYSEAELGSVPDGANLGLGCGNPVALASLKEGETVLDLGSGAGFDCFLAANKVGKAGRVIGVDMTPEMLDKARQNARKGKYGNVEFRRGEIEKLPVEDNYVDVIISNCVINLSPDKLAVFREAFRVLKPGGRLMVSDIVLLAELPDFIKESVAAYVGCISGAMLKDDYLGAIKSAGFKDIKVIEETNFPIESMANDPTAQVIMKEMKITPEKVKEIGQAVLSVKVQAVKGKN
jgi:ubiquinone/menaquinone biosynthesis C-methylase UbiE